jgi:Fe-S-cluster containining protein
MQDLKKVKTISSELESHGQWLTEYLRTRAYLASSESTFSCDPACTRPGCKNQDLQVPVSVVDLLGIAGHRGESVSELYRRTFVLGLFSNERDDWIRMVALRLKKPCPFLEHDQCSIYPVRPLPCMLFPEYLVSRGTFEATAGKDQFRDYLCLHRPLQLSPDRAKVIAKLRSMWDREMLISSFYLFNAGPCHLDFSNLIRELLAGARSLKEPELEEKSEMGRSIANQDLEHFFWERLATYQPFVGVGEKIYHLDTGEGQVQFLQLLQDNRLLKKLWQDGDDRALVFRFRKGQLKAKRRGIIPAEYKFTW